MKMFLLVIGCILLYLLLSIITTILVAYMDRINGLNENDVYSDYETYVVVGFFWPIVLPAVIVILFYLKFKLMFITVVELMVLNTKKKSDR